jgi:hypothetical protein
VTRTAPTLRACLLALAVLPLLAAAAAADDDEPAPKEKLVPLEEFFRGKVLTIKGSFVEIEYSFDSAAELRDFQDSIPFRAKKDVAWKLEKGRVRLTGTGSMRHKAVFKDVAGATAEFQPVRNRDFGFAISEERESEVYTLYCVYDEYFGSTDNVFEPQNMIIKFLARDPKRNANGLQDWRYCGSRGQKPVIKRGGKYTVTAHREGLKSRLEIGDWVSKGKEAGRDLTAMMVSVYGYGADGRVLRLVVRGDLDPDFVARHKLDLAPPPEPEKPAETEVDEGPQLPADETARVQARIADYPARTKPRALAKMLRDTALPKTLRQAAAQRAQDAGSMKIVPWLMDGMYDDDVTSRRLSSQVFKGLTGKTFGYRADAGKDSRARALKKMAEWVQKNAAKLR